MFNETCTGFNKEHCTSYDFDVRFLSPPLRYTFISSLFDLLNEYHHLSPSVIYDPQIQHD